ncbi:uncharacterized protein C8R40DRAFT_1073339 [Lentinula edodes]|uniref:uncharacterized protein n=1 Tax=Lentinula edodes TaxID=5353 RepID=UPI001E8EC8D1|nr:uncharacterized protein C8R40DRAFT_1073339 [Lentinula edodes]KAH7870265.1 hypothetical protein C8R40DRAFT_1073339 [Lentinula edodes]
MSTASSTDDTDTNLEHVECSFIEEYTFADETGIDHTQFRGTPNEDRLAISEDWKIFDSYSMKIHGALLFESPEPGIFSVLLVDFTVNNVSEFPRRQVQWFDKELGHAVTAICPLPETSTGVDSAFAVALFTGPLDDFLSFLHRCPLVVASEFPSAMKALMLLSPDALQVNLQLQNLRLKKRVLLVGKSMALPVAEVGGKCMDPVKMVLNDVVSDRVFKFKVEVESGGIRPIAMHSDACSQPNLRAVHKQEGGYLDTIRASTDNQAYSVDEKNTLLAMVIDIEHP